MIADMSLTTSISAPSPAPADAVTPGPHTGLTFGEVLSDLNPLQYLPVVGTIYRAITGDTIPRPLREAGSLVVSGLIGGPVGVVTNLAILAFEKLTGIDLEDVEQNILTALTGSKASGPAAAVAAAPQTAAAGPPDGTLPTSQAAPAAGGPWTASQLAAYGIVTRPDGTLQQGKLTGADVLNELQLRTTALAA